MNKKVVDPYLIDVNIISTTNNRCILCSEKIDLIDIFGQCFRFPESFFLLLIDTPISLNGREQKKHQKKYYLYKKHPNEKIRPTKNIILPKRKKSSSSSDRAKKTRSNVSLYFKSKKLKKRIINTIHSKKIWSKKRKIHVIQS